MQPHKTIVVITPVRNEAWLLDAFLTCTSSWADHIIIADHHSTDGSREIAKKYPKVTLIDNPCQEWVEHICRARLLEEAAKIEGDKIICGIDADEFLSEGFDKTPAWNRIINSTQNEIFCFNWLNLYDDFNHSAEQVFHAEWIAHYTADVDIVAEYKKRNNSAVHCSRVPCLETDRCKYINIDDFQFVHLAKLNHHRIKNKTDFYQVVNFDKNEKKANPIAMYRSYNAFYPPKVNYHKSPIKLYCMGENTDYSHLIRESDNGQHYIEEIRNIISRKGPQHFQSLCIWDNPDIIKLGTGFIPKLPCHIKFLHLYLSHTQPFHRNRIVRIIDKILKRIYRF